MQSKRKKLFWKPTVSDIRNIKKRLKKGEFQHHIAADYGINQGRISEINTGKRLFSDDGGQGQLL